MPASTPGFGIPKVALVNAKLIVDGQNRGARFFIVPICNEHEMYRGVFSKRLPPRSGTNPLDFSITQFDNVQLPPTALVASDITNFALPERPLEAWWDEVRGNYPILGGFMFIYRSGVRFGEYNLGQWPFPRRGYLH